MGPKNCLPEQSSSVLNEKGHEDEDLYRKKENRGTEGAT